MAKEPDPAEWLDLREALRRFALAEGGHQGARHIKPLHWYVASRLVLEGGFDPDEITPRPPFIVRRKAKPYYLEHDPSRGGSGERTVLGGLKTKDVDVVVSKSGIGPCLAISLKGSLNAFRNLTNRMEEAVGDCTNLHIAYPALVYGFWHVLRANRSGPLPANAPFLKGDDDGNISVPDVAITTDGRAVDSIARYHQALSGLTGRSGMRDDVSRYEAVALTLVDAEVKTIGKVVGNYPEIDSTLRLDGFFKRLYDEYDLRFVYQAPALEQLTRRMVWNRGSDIFADPRIQGFDPRVEG